jgi:hypothetical protein
VISVEDRAAVACGPRPPAGSHGVAGVPIRPGRTRQNEIFDGATPYTTYVRGVIIDGDRGVLLTGRYDSALITEG